LRSARATVNAYWKKKGSKPDRHHEKGHDASGKQKTQSKD
jgi:hypothetical protein